jgi:eukaryotic-like serine/threonine-protein kinase
VSNTPPISPTIPGTVLAGKYRVEKIIGQGGMGLVVEAKHIALDERVALKFLLPEYASHPEASQRFLREARAAVKIKSEHVARVSDVGTLDSGAPYMVMEYLDGADLSKTLEKLGVLPIQDAIDYIVQGCEAIAEAHQHGIVHRDLKPANLFLSKRPDGMPIVKVLDFGISKVMGGGVDNLTKTTAAMGSALYMSPEQMQQTRAVDHRTDIYALGVALYELLAGKQPYYADTLPQLCAEILTGTPTAIRSVRPEVPEELAAVLEKAYARDKGQRYQSIADLVIALAPFAPARTQGTLDRVARMAGLPIPVAGAAPPRPATPSNPPMGGTVVIEPGEAPRLPPAPGWHPSPPQAPPPQYAQPPPQQGRGSPATVPLPVMDPTRNSPVPAAPPPPFNPNQIVPGPYHAPVSTRAAANFAQTPGGQGPQGQTTDGSMSTGAAPRASGGGSKMGLLIAAVVGVLALGGVGLAFALKGKAPTGSPVPATSLTAPEPSAPKAEPTAPAEPKTAEPPPSAAVPVQSAAAEPKPHPGVPGIHPKGTTTTAPVVPPKPSVDPLSIGQRKP